MDLADSAMMPKLATDIPVGVVAGSGELPRMVVERFQRDRRPFMVVAFQNETSPETVVGTPHIWLTADRLGSGIKELKFQGYRNLVMVGRVARPEITSLTPDFSTVRLLYRLLKARRTGDDAVLAQVVSFMEDRGFTVHGVQDVMPDIVAPQGVMGSITPDARAQADVALGTEVGRHMGQYDIGQGVVVQGGRVLAVEAAEGTDEMLARVAPLQNKTPGGVLVKLCKPGQDVRVDLPAVGPETVRNAAKAGLRGIALEAGRSVMIRREAMIAEANRLGLFLYGVKS
jgi:DUF1009 family protein